MSGEDLEIENVDRAERLLINKYVSIPNNLIASIDKIRQNLVSHEVDQKLLDRINDVMYKATLMNDLKDVEDSIKYLADTFWHQNYLLG